MNKAFVISPIGAKGSPQRLDADFVLNEIIRPAALECGFDPYRGDHVSSPGMIVSQMCDSIHRDPLIFAYLKAGNPNVYYELAVAHTLRKPLVLLKASDEVIPFDIGGARIVTVDSQNVPHCISAVKSQIVYLMNPANEISNPLSMTAEKVLFSQLPRIASGPELPFDISGRWTGFTIETFPPGSDGPYKKYHAEIRMEAKGRYVTGSVFIAYGDDFDQPAQNTGVLQLHGLSRSPRFARLTYDNDRIQEHCGTLFLEFNDDGMNAVGVFGGCGIASRQPVHGKITLRRAES